MKKIMILTFLFWCSQAYCDAVSKDLQAKLNQIRTMSASFSQEVKARRRNISQSSGTMALVRPGHFRWQTQKPMSQVVIADGKRLWVYDADLEQVSVKRQASGVGGTAGLFLSGYGNTVARDFNVTVAKSGNQQIFDLRPKSSKSNFQRLKLTFDGASLIGMELFDQLGQYTKIHLSHVKTNIALAPTLFQFKAPKGVDVVSQ